MKKKLLFVTIILILLAGVLYYISLPDYLVFNSMSFSNGANRDTELQVIVYQYWNTDEVIAEIEAEHNQINGTPTIPTINLYHSKWSFHNGYDHFIAPLSIMIEKEKQTALAEIERVNKKLSNASFVDKAPAAVVDGEKAKLAKYTEMLANVEDMLKALDK